MSVRGPAPIVILADVARNSDRSISRIGLVFFEAAATASTAFVAVGLLLDWRSSFDALESGLLLRLNERGNECGRPGLLNLLRCGRNCGRRATEPADQSVLALSLVVGYAVASHWLTLAVLDITRLTVPFCWRRCKDTPLF